MALLVLLVAVSIPFLTKLLYPSDNLAFTLDQVANDGSARNVVVTGANSGLGLATVEHMAQLPNSHVIMACRSMAKCETARSSVKKKHATARLSCIPLDLGSRTSIESFATILQQHLDKTNSSVESLEKQPIHILVNNAGQMGNSKTIGYIDNVETHIQVNHLGHVLLTHCLWKHLLMGKGRIVNVSSLAALLPVNPVKAWTPATATVDVAADKSGWSAFLDNFTGNWLYYARSKRANLMFTSELHHLYKNTVVTAVASHPGYTRTPLLQNGFQFVPEAFRSLMHNNRIGSASPKEGAMTQVRAALDDHLVGGVHVGPKNWTAGEAVPVGTVLGWTSHHWPFSREESRLLWTQSLDTLGIREFGVSI
jgi:NAD(P)-dependent dehydrogenase (short-subunit alcohol dehydrogenase family)